MPTDEQLATLRDEAGPALGVLQGLLARGDVGNVTAVDSRAEPGFITVDFDTGECLAFAHGAADPALTEALYLAIAAAAGRLKVNRH